MESRRRVQQPTKKMSYMSNKKLFGSKQLYTTSLGGDFLYALFSNSTSMHCYPRWKFQYYAKYSNESLILKRVALVVCYVGHNPQTLLNGKFP